MCEVDDFSFRMQATFEGGTLEVFQIGFEDVC